MAAHSLVLCRDPEVLRVLYPLLFELNIGVEVCPDGHGLKTLLRKRKFDTVIVECGAGGEGLEVIQHIRSEKNNRKTIAVGVVNDYTTMKSAFATGANFVLSKPISRDDAVRILRVTAGLVARAVRRFLRIGVSDFSFVDVEGAPEPAFLLDLSEGGVAVQGFAPLKTNTNINIGFSIPGSPDRIRAKGHVAWCDSSGRAGIEFDEIADADRAEIKKWILLTVPKVEVSDAELVIPISHRRKIKWDTWAAAGVDVGFILAAAVLFYGIVNLFYRQAEMHPSPFFLIGATGFIAGLYAVLLWALGLKMAGDDVLERLSGRKSRSDTIQDLGISEL